MFGMLKNENHAHVHHLNFSAQSGQLYGVDAVLLVEYLLDVVLNLEVSAGLPEHVDGRPVHLVQPQPLHVVVDRQLRDELCHVQVVHRKRLISDLRGVVVRQLCREVHLEAGLSSLLLNLLRRFLVKVDPLDHVDELLLRFCQPDVRQVVFRIALNLALEVVLYYVVAYSFLFSKNRPRVSVEAIFVLQLDLARTDDLKCVHVSARRGYHKCRHAV